MTLTMAEYDVQVGQHLQAICAGAAMVESHISQLVYRPAFQTLAYDRIEIIERELADALDKIRSAKLAYQGKPVD